jgi:hypothetical protein
MFVMCLAFGRLLTRQEAVGLVPQFVKKRLLKNMAANEPHAKYLIQFLERCLREKPSERPDSVVWFLAVRAVFLRMYPVFSFSPEPPLLA